MTRRISVLSGLVLSLAALMLGLLAPAADAARLPTKRQWSAQAAGDLRGSLAYLRQQVAAGVSRPAINLDIDNTALATHYDRGKVVRSTLRLARYAKSIGVAVVFNTGRSERGRNPTRRELRRAGFAVDRLCMRKVGEPVRTSKQRCRRWFVQAGFTLVENVGNHTTDFVGGRYQRGYKLPDYGGRLG